MIHAPTAGQPALLPALLPALAAMTWLQALVALALFAPGAVAPSAHLDILSLSMFSTAVFAVGVVTSFWTGGLINRVGSLRMATLCGSAVIASMALAAFGSGPALLLAGLCLGLAFGPETPASAALLGKLVTGERRPLVFSVRQTGNQIGAVCGSLALPAIAIWLAPRWSFATVGACAIGGIIVFEWLRPRYKGLALAPPQLGIRARLALVSSDRRIAALAAASIPFSGMQLALNTFFVSLGVRELGLGHLEAGAALACAQAGGLFGRLGWGFLAMRINSARIVLIGLGLGMAVCAAVFGLWGGMLGKAGQYSLAAAFGLTASGWNGIFLAEVARLAPQDRIGETTGAVLTASYAGLLVTPVLISAIETLAGLAGAFIGLAILAFGGTVALLRGGAR
ncbi:MFS transporter [Bradyrhizobium sp. SSUT18]|uniref:MFS transporter n=1 Tax=Bradyrhizobium sp. SSUT18 TaxID=3040602 RepID=UPI00244A340F|nr:MFS transporter [Bradyrhizobium sp. SSUT18]MDH2401226.1 MFS transporter [Bradyrhizobium sp. SSUT18]